MPAHASPVTARQVRNEELDSILQRRWRAKLLDPQKLAGEIAEAVEKKSREELADIALLRAPFDYETDPARHRDRMRQWADRAKTTPRAEIEAYVLDQFSGYTAAPAPSPDSEDEETKAFHQSFDPPAPGAKPESSPAPHPDEPILRGLLREAAAHQLVGLALSGGGIRSASFNLGLIEALQEHDLLRHVDYLSTVSGGGYMGSHLSSAMLKTGASLEKDRCPLQPGPANEPSPQVRKMIYGGKYLNDPVKLFNRFLVGLFYNNLVFFSLLFVGCCLIALVWRGLDQHPVHTFLSWISGGNVIDFNRPFLPFLVATAAWLLCWAAIYWWWLCSTIPRRERILLEIAITAACLAVAWANIKFQLWSPFWPFLVNFSVILIVLVLAWLYSWKTIVAGCVALGFAILYVASLDAEDRVNLVNQTASILGLHLTVLPWLLVCCVAYWKDGITVMAMWQKRFLIAAAAGFLVGGVVWLGIPNMNTLTTEETLIAPGTSKEINNVESYVLPVLIAALGLGLLPFLKPAELIRSGERPKSKVHLSIFRVASFSLLVGIPLACVYFLARHNVSGHADDLSRPMVSTDIRDWETFWPKLMKIADPQQKEPQPHYLVKRLRDEDAVNSALLISPKDLARLERRDKALLDPKETKWPAWLEVETTRNAIVGNINAVLSEKATTVKLLTSPAMLEALRKLKDADLTKVVLDRKQKDLFMRLRGEADTEGKRDPRPRPAQWVELVVTAPSLAGVKLAAVEAKRLQWLLEKYGQAHLSSTTEEAATAGFLERLLDLGQSRGNEEAEVVSSTTLTRNEWITLNHLLLRSQFPDDIWPRDRVRRLVVIEADQAFRLKWLLWSLLGLVVFALVVNANATSPHWFYRDQLAKAYIVPRDDNEPTPQGQPRRWKHEILLAEMRTTDHGAPYHLLCAAINQDAPNKDRVLDSSHFLFSQRYCGSEATGFESSATYVGGQMDLPTAMAISGAAVSPLRVNNPLVAIIMTILNFRLGQWLPRPCHEAKASSVVVEEARRWPTFFALFIDYLTAWDNPANRKYFFLSDGGHDENLGIQQLLARRCRFILASDAGQDQDHEFADLCKVYRRARLDGIRMWHLDQEGKAMSLDNLLLEKSSGMVKDHFLLVGIRYPDNSKGWLVYLKPSFCGSEEIDLRFYRSQNPTFPHDPTAQVMFEPDQVESYRQLGASIGRKICADLKAMLDSKPTSVDKLVATLLKRSLPANDWGEFPHPLQAALTGKGNGSARQPKP